MDDPRNRLTTRLRRGPGWPAFALTGLLAALVGMAIGHLLAGLVLPEASPVVAVGNGVIVRTPESMKEWAIRRFGSNDKAVLVGSVVVATLVLAAAAGMASRRRPRIGVAFAAILGAVVIAAARSSKAVQSAHGSFPGATVLPGIAAAISAVLTLLLLRRLALGLPWRGPLLAPAPTQDRATTEPNPTGDDADDDALEPVESPLDHSAVGYHPGTTARRRFLAGAAGAAGGSIVAGAIGRRLAAPKPVADIADLVVDSTAPRLPAGLDAEVPGISPFRTPARDFYRVDTALVIPRIDRGSWRLQVDGGVDTELDLSFDELVNRFELIERDVTLNCVSNEVGGPYISSGRWLGVRTSDVLAAAGIRRGTEQILSTSSDGMTISTPIQALTDDREAMIAIGLNGDALSRERGYPARLVTPGLYGFVGATKWLVRMTATTYDDGVAYWTERKWATDAPVKTASRIDTPKSFARVPAGTVRIGGVAWAQRRGIERVEIQVDDDAWQPATLGPEANIDYWRQWYCDVRIDQPGRHDLRVRATDGTGAVQTAERARPFPSGATGWASISIEVG
jgi:DMSO/TMAO reductase YedYZ molybdopterin-dependent catalytic subunit